MEGDKVHVLGIDVSRGNSSCALLHDHTVVKEFRIVHNKSGLAKLKSIITSDSPVGIDQKLLIHGRRPYPKPYE